MYRINGHGAMQNAGDDERESCSGVGKKWKDIEREPELLTRESKQKQHK